MKHIILGLIFIVSPFLLIAHNPLSSKYSLETGADASVLTINLSQDGVNKVLLDKYGASEINQMEQKEFKELIVNYVKNNFYLFINKEKVELQKGGIRFGNHQTDLKFVLPAFPNDLEAFDIEIPAFQENENHQTIFVYNVLGKEDKVILSTKNDYKATIRIVPESKSDKWLWIILGSSLSLTLIFIIRSVFRKGNET